MATEDFGGIQVEVCTSGCRGIWFDEGELRRLDTKRKGMGPNLERALKEPVTAGPERGLIDCPTCDEPMDQIEYEYYAPVTVDSCGCCGGMYLDAGELGAIRGRQLTANEESGQRRLRKRRIRRMLKRRRERERRAHANCGMLMMAAAMR